MPTDIPAEDRHNILQDGNDENEIVVNGVREDESFFSPDSFDFIDNGPGESFILQYDHNSGVGRLVQSGPNGPTYEYFDHSHEPPHRHDTPSDVIFVEPSLDYDIM